MRAITSGRSATKPARAASPATSRPDVPVFLTYCLDSSTITGSTAQPRLRGPMRWRRNKARGRDVIDVRGAARKGGGASGSGGFGGLPIPGNIAGVGGGAGLLIVLVIVAIQI